MGIGYAAIDTVALNAIEQDLELTHDHHVAQYAPQAMVTDALALFPDGRVVGIERDGLEMDLAGLANEPRINHQRFDHACLAPEKNGLDGCSHAALGPTLCRPSMFP